MRIEEKIEKYLTEGTGPDYKKYGIEVGQIYVPADGSKGELEVIDVSKYEKQGDIIVRNRVGSTAGKETRIDAFKLAMTRYQLKKNKR